MEDFFKEKLKKFDQNTYQVSFIQGVENICQSCINKVKSSMPQLKFGKKIVHKTIIKHCYLLETLIQTLKRGKQKTKLQQPTDSKDFNEITKRHKAEKKLRAEIIKLEEDEAQVRFLKENAEEKLKDYESQIQLQQKKQQLLEDLSLKAKLRQEDINKQKKILEEPLLNAKPKYIEMAENYKQLFEFPELERRKAELAKKRSLYLPISRQDWLDHMKKYNNLSMEAGKKRLKSLEQKSVDRVKLVNKAKKDFEIENELIRENVRKMAQKRKQYGDIVREVFAPKSEHKEQKKLVKSEKNNELIKRNEQIQYSIEKTPHKPVKKPKNKSTKVQSITPELKNFQLDYLAEKRKQRSELKDYNIEFPKLEITANEEKSKALQNLKKIDEILISQNYRLRNSDPCSLQALELEANLNDLWTKSIKAKLSLL